MQIILSKDSSKFLHSLGSPKFGQQIGIKLKELAMHGHLNDSRALKGKLSGYHRVDVGEFRIIYHIEDNELLVPLIEKA